MRVKAFLSVLFLSAVFPLFAEENVFNLSPGSESIILGSGAALYGTYLLCDKILKIDKPLSEERVFDRSDVNPFDRVFMNSYKKSLDYASTFVGAGVVASAGIMAFAPVNQWLTIGTMYAETLLWAYSLKSIGKLAAGRSRPYMYFDNIPDEAYTEGDWNDSFPSAHSTFVFAAAAFTNFVFNKYFPESVWKYAVFGGTYSVAAFTAYLRIASGTHFLTDVLAGAAIGTLCGFVIPWIHTLPVISVGNKTLSFASCGISNPGIILSVKI